jgi:hypothetical protein
MLKGDWIILDNNENVLSQSDTGSTNSDSDTEGSPKNIRIEIESPKKTIYGTNETNSDMETIDYSSNGDDENNDDHNHKKSRKIMACIFLTGCLYITFVVSLPTIYNYFS